jgi:hypothetical protein
MELLSMERSCAPPTHPLSQKQTNQIGTIRGGSDKQIGTIVKNIPFSTIKMEVTLKYTQFLFFS